jgi:PST family polysaccharide transporter
MNFGIFHALKKLGVSTSIKILCILFLNKFFAHYYGAEGILLYSQVNNYISLILVISTLGLSNGIVKTVIDYGLDHGRSLFFLISTRNILLINAVLLGLLSICLNTDIVHFFFKTTKFSYLVNLSILISVANVFFVVFISLINARLEYKKYNMISNRYHLILIFGTVLLFFSFGFEAAIVWIFFSQVLNLIVVALSLSKDKWFSKLFSLGSFKIHSSSLKVLLPFFFISFVSGVASPITITYVRNFIIDFGGESLAGYWEALNRISGVSLTFFTAVLGTYLVPAISGLRRDEEVSFIHRGLRDLSVIIIPFIILINISSKYLIIFLFNKDFLIINDIVFSQTIGDYFKGLSLLFSYFMISKKMTYHFITLEIIASFIYALFSQYFLNIYGLSGVSYAYLLTYVTYFLVSYSFVVYYRR